MKKNNVLILLILTAFLCLTTGDTNLSNLESIECVANSSNYLADSKMKEINNETIETTVTVPEETTITTTAPVTTAVSTTAKPVTVTVQKVPAVKTLPELQQELAPQIDTICRKYNVTGMSMAVFKGQDIIYIQSYGYADISNRIAVNEDTKFRIASISKTITAMLAMKLESEGKLNIDEDISNYIGINMKSAQYPDTKITTRQLMTHTSGLADSNSYNSITDGCAYPSLQEIMSYGGIYSGAAPGSRYLYSNFGAGLISGVIEGVTGERFYDYAQKTLIDPLGIDAGFLRTKIKDSHNIAQIYKNQKLNADVRNWGRVESAYNSIPIGQMYLLGHGDLIISAKDLAKFGIALADGGMYNGISILPKESVNKINSIQFQSGKNKIGLGISVTNSLVQGRTMYGHPGQALGMVSGMYYDPKDKTGVVFITNGCTVQKNSNDIYTISDEIVKTVYWKLINVLPK